MHAAGLRPLSLDSAVQQREPERAWDLLASSAQASTQRDQFLLRASDLRRGDERARLSVETSASAATAGESAQVPDPLVWAAGSSTSDRWWGYFHQTSSRTRMMLPPGTFWMSPSE